MTKPDDSAPASGSGTHSSSFDFSEKLRILEGVIGYRFPSHYFKGNFLADLFNIHTSQMSKKKNGTVPVTNWELSKLIDLYQLGDRIDYKTFKLETHQFEETLKSMGVGTYGSNSVAVARRNILKEAALSDDLIKVIRDTRKTRSGGFGLAEAESNSVPTFRILENAYFIIPISGPGFLYVLSDLVDIGMTCLVPSQFAMNPRVDKGSVRIPAEPDLFDVTGPPAYFRLYAIYSTQEVELEWLKYDKKKPGPLAVPELELPKLVDALQTIRTNGGDFSIASRDYRVLP